MGGSLHFVWVVGVENLIARHCGFVVVPVAFRSGQVTLLFSASRSRGHCQ